MSSAHRPGLTLPAVLATSVIVATMWSGMARADRATRWRAVAAVPIASPPMAATWRRLPLTPEVSMLIAVLARILSVGGHHTEAKVPLGFGMQDGFDFTRNHCDRIGHDVQGFVPAIVAREIPLHRSSLKRGDRLLFVVCCVGPSIAASYEPIEWAAAAT